MVETSDLLVRALPTQMKNFIGRSGCSTCNDTGELVGMVIKQINVD